MANGDPVPPSYYANTAPEVVDWADMVSFSPAVYFRPDSIDSLIAFLNQTLAQPGEIPPIRTLGGLHSCSRICESGTIIDTTALPRTLDFDPGNAAVVATANWHLHDFLYELGQVGKSLTCTGGTDAQTLAGLISTNTAGATAHHSVYETVEWIEYLTLADGGQSFELRQVASGDPAFPAVVCSLGAIGFLTRVRFSLIDQPFYNVVQQIRSLQDVLEDLDQTSAQYDFWRIDWIPNTESGLFWGAAPASVQNPDGDYPTDHTENVLRFAMGAIEKFQDNGPYLSGALEVVYELLTRTYGVQKASGPLRNMLPVDRKSPLHVAMAEWSFAPADIWRVIDSCGAYFRQRRWPNLPIEIELARTDNYFMSAWNWPGLPYIVKFNFMYLTDFLSDAEKDEVIEHLRGLWNFLQGQGIAFKAHWGKINFMDADFVAANYRLDQFEPYIHPLFLNDYLRVRLNAVSAHLDRT